MNYCDKITVNLLRFPRKMSERLKIEVDMQIWRLNGKTFTLFISGEGFSS